MELDELDRLAVKAFDGYLVRKDLAQRFKGQYPVPRQDRNMLYADGESKLAHVGLPNGLKWAQILAHTRRVRYA